VRALLIVNPHATSTTRTRRDVIVRALASAVDLEVVQTRYRGEATKVAATAAAQNYGLVMTLGGDGTVNEAVNGLLTGEGSEGSEPPDAAQLPALAALPGGNANVFTRSLRLPADPVDAAGQIIDDIVAGRERRIGLGAALLSRETSPAESLRYFTFNAGLGWDAEVVRAVESRRTDGRAISAALYGRMALRQYYRMTDRRNPAIAFAEPADLKAERVYWCIVCNSAPWTFIGDRPVNATPQASFDTGLDLLAMRRFRTISTARTLRQMLSARTEPLRGRDVLACHDLPAVEIHADRPVALQLDGEYVGEVESVRFRSVPQALRVVGLGALN
jgi:diacylglycerol kinase family enzyme